MAYIPTVWENDITDVDEDNMNHIEEGVKNSYNVSLLAVSDTAPSECNEGDKYYNTTTNEIYTATGTDTWSEDGEEPLQDILYVVFGEQNTYAYDGTQMLSVGGGSTTVFNLEYAVLNGKRKDITGNTAWTNYDINFNSNDEFSTSNSDLFEMTSTGIKCKFAGPCLIIRAFTLDSSTNDYEFDMIDDYRTYYLTRGVNKNNFNVKSVSNNEIIGIRYVANRTDFIIYNSRIIVIKLK